MPKKCRNSTYSAENKESKIYHAFYMDFIKELWHNETCMR